MIHAYRLRAKLPGRLLLLLIGLTGGGQVVPGFSQACTGVLGGAVINQTFGSNGPYRLQPGQTTYQNVEQCPQDGEYLIAGSTDCYGGTWHNVPGDHTPGDVDGNMLIVNAAQGPGEFYKEPIAGLCYGTTYELSIWVINLMNNLPTNGCYLKSPVPLDPDVTLRIETPDGRVLQTINTDRVPRTGTPAWLRYATVFTLPPGQNSVVVKVVNNGPGGCGNDLALDDIQLRPCRPALRINFQDATATTLALCEGGTALMQLASGTNYATPAYQWQASSDSVSWQPIPNGADPLYTAQAPAGGKIYYRLLGAPVTSGAAPWDTACSTVSNTLTITTLTGRACGYPPLYVPDSFTPNADGVNDAFRAYYDDSGTYGNAGLDQYEMTVYNRWGSVVFVSREINSSWDGTYIAQPCSEGAYTWVVRYQFARTNPVRRFHREGRVLLLR